MNKKNILIASLSIVAIGITAYLLWHKYGVKKPNITAEQKNDLKITFNRN